MAVLTVEQQKLDAPACYCATAVLTYLMPQCSAENTLYHLLLAPKGSVMFGVAHKNTKIAMIACDDIGV